MSAALVLPFVLPAIQARAELLPIPRRTPKASVLHRVQASAACQPQLRPAPRPQLAFYRKYTEAILRRYMRMSLEVGRVPSVLGRGEMFRARVSSYRMESFEDVVIFCHDVERCIARVNPGEQFLLDRIGVKRYTALETAEMLRCSPRSTIRRYLRALDQLTSIFLELKILHMPNSCQAPKTVENAPSECNESNNNLSGKRL